MAGVNALPQWYVTLLACVNSDDMVTSGATPTVTWTSLRRGMGTACDMSVMLVPS